MHKGISLETAPDVANFTLYKEKIIPHNHKLPPPKKARLHATKYSHMEIVRTFPSEAPDGRTLA